MGGAGSAHGGDEKCMKKFYVSEMGFGGCALD